VGKRVYPPEEVIPEKPQGSIMMVLATNAPFSSRQLRRLCVRGGIGLGRTGSIFGNTSGDVVIAFSTAHRIPYRPLQIVNSYFFVEDVPDLNNLFFHAAADCIEEAILNSLFQAQTVEGRDGNICNRLPVEQVVEMVKQSQKGWKI
jgi:D-aminopeptidase